MAAVRQELGLHGRWCVECMETHHPEVYREIRDRQQQSKIANRARRQALERLIKAARQPAKRPRAAPAPRPPRPPRPLRWLCGVCEARFSTRAALRVHRRATGHRGHHEGGETRPRSGRKKGQGGSSPPASYSPSPCTSSGEEGDEACGSGDTLADALDSEHYTQDAQGEASE